jgi:hypothetical protein
LRNSKQSQSDKCPHWHSPAYGASRVGCMRRIQRITPFGIDRNILKGDSAQRTAGRDRLERWHDPVVGYFHNPSGHAFLARYVCRMLARSVLVPRWLSWPESCLTMRAISENSQYTSQSETTRTYWITTGTIRVQDGFAGRRQLAVHYKTRFHPFALVPGH